MRDDAPRCTCSRHSFLPNSLTDLPVVSCRVALSGLFQRLPRFMMMVLRRWCPCPSGSCSCGLSPSPSLVCLPRASCCLLLPRVSSTMFTNRCMLCCSPPPPSHRGGEAEVPVRYCVRGHDRHAAPEADPNGYLVHHAYHHNHPARSVPRAHTGALEP